MFREYQNGGCDVLGRSRVENLVSKLSCEKEMAEEAIPREQDWGVNKLLRFYKC